MTRKQALQICMELAAHNSLTPRECDGDEDLIAVMREQNEALMIVAEMIDEQGDMLEALQAAIVDLEVVASNLSDEPNGLDPQDCAEVCAKIAADFRALVIKVTAPYRARF